MFRKSLAAAAVFTASVLAVFLFAAEKPVADQRKAANEQLAAGNIRDAYEIYRKLALDPQNDPKAVGGDLTQAIHSLRQLGRVDEIDALREQVIEIHSKNWRLLHTAAESYIDGEHIGFIVAGEFSRGHKRGGGRYVNSIDRDRVRALQLMELARGLLEGETDSKALGEFYLDFARMVLYGRSHTSSWRLQELTKIEELPDFEDGYRGYGRSGAAGAPVDADGNPVFHTLPESYEAAKTDGERWRSLLAKAQETDPGRANEVRSIFAGFLHEQFGVQTMGHYGSLFGRQHADEDKDESGPYALHTLDKDETIAKLATGIKRFKLPDEFNFIRIFQQVADSGKSGHGEQALNTLAQIFENRRQYPKAAEYWRRNIEQYGPGQNDYKRLRLGQIIGNWGRFENATVQPAGKKATVEFRYRNAEKVHFEAHEIKVSDLLDDVKVYLKSNPGQLDWQRMNIADIGYRLVQFDPGRYLGDKTAAWEVDLEPRDAHFDSRITVDTPLEKPGAYLLTAKVAGGNTTRIIIWVDDTAIVQKHLGDRAFYFVADAVTGTPVAKANLEFFGYQQKHLANNRYQITTSNFAESTDADGQAFPDPAHLKRGHQWVVIARTDDGRFAYLGFNSIWYGRSSDPVYNQNKVLAITDRPVYRPNQPVKFKLWVQNARYDAGDVSRFAHLGFTVRVTNPQGEAVLEKQFQADEFGGLEGEYQLPADAMLGQYGIGIINRGDVGGGGSFRVEEYKKPEFEVTVDAPADPIALGEKITATIRAKYYFGAPVVHAQVHYKVLRTSHTQQWYPSGEWDWLYGPGYWWFNSDYGWYPGWNRWGVSRPIPFWWGRGHEAPEVVLDNSAPIGADGTLKVEIDTALAKEIHGDQNHRYQIVAEVVDQSRRTIVGNGEVLAARQPFQVFAWADRGHYRAGDTVRASFQARTLDGKPVQGEGTLTLLKITYDADGKPTENAVQAWDIDTNDRGEASQQLTAAEAGQYRLSYKVTDAKERTIEGGYLFTVIGTDADESDFRFNAIELVVDKREYQPGDKVRLLINTNRPGATVALFLRPANGVYPRPEILRLDGKTTVREITVAQRDMPNFFIEAFTISDGRFHSETREVIVPPEGRIVNVDVLPSATEYKPGAEAKVKVKVTDLAGEPFVGSTVLSIYDKSVEYISGGSNVPEIKAYFWKWRRSHYPQSYTSLQRYFGNLLKPGEAGMGNLGAFGHILVQSEGAKDKAEEKQMAGQKLELERAAEPAATAAPANAYFEDRADARSGLRKNALADGLAADFDVGGGFGGGALGPDDGTALVEPTVRKNFADTALWAGSLTTNKEGLAEVSLIMPDTLTTWKVRAWTLGHGTRVGQGEAEVVTNKHLLVRMQAPRFFTEKDEVVLSANVHNYLQTPKQTQVVLELDGEALVPLDDLARTVELPAAGEKRIDWRVKAAKTGEAVVRMKALTDEESDAMEMRFPVYVHGMLKTESFTGVIRPDKQSAAFSITVPAERRINETRLEVRFSPTLAGAMVDALPYLVDYPYGCTEQTLNRFLPTVITQNILKRMDLDLKAIQEKRTNLNAQEAGDPQVRAAQWKHKDRNPVFDEAEVARMVKDGVKRLTEMQVSDGGWGWFSGFGERSMPHTTAVVVHGLQLAAENGVALVPGVLDRGVNWLKNYQNQQIELLKNAVFKSQADSTDALVFMVLADAGVTEDRMQAYLYRDRVSLPVYAKALFGLALHKLGEQDQLAMIIKNIDQFLVQDDENQTAYLKLPNKSSWWYWWGSETEANAYYLKLLAKTDPQSEKASRLVKYLLNNRKHASYWNSTRDTAIAVEALAAYLVASGEDRPDMTVEILYDGQKQKEVRITAENLFTFDNTFDFVGDAVDAGAHSIEIRKRGVGPLYFNASLANFTLEDFITRAGLEIKVNRKYYRLIRKDAETTAAGARGQAVDQRVEKYEREELDNLATLKSGDLVEIELEIDSKNDYEYLIFEDKKAAGFEPVDLQSGYNGNDLGAYMELRDDRVNFFVRTLARGKHSVSYRLRAEIPGTFSALPTFAYAMYAPELRGNSDEIKVSITD